MTPIDWNKPIEAFDGSISGGSASAHIVSGYEYNPAGKILVRFGAVSRNHPAGEGLADFITGYINGTLAVRNVATAEYVGEMHSTDSDQYGKQSLRGSQP